MKGKKIDNEEWNVYRKSDEYIPECIINEEEEIICWLHERVYGDSEFEKEEIETLEFRSRIIKNSPDMYRLLKDIFENLCEEKEIKNYKNKIKEIILNIGY